MSVFACEYFGKGIDEQGILPSNNTRDSHPIRQDDASRNDGISPELARYQLMLCWLLEDTMHCKAGSARVLATVCLNGPFSRHHESSSTHNAHLREGMLDLIYLGPPSFHTTTLADNIKRTSSVIVPRPQGRSSCLRAEAQEED